MAPHRADIVSPKGYVVEVQHSTISADEIAERDAFYPTVAAGVFWILDATGSPPPRFERGQCSGCGAGQKVSWFFECTGCATRVAAQRRLACEQRSHCPQCARTTLSILRGTRVPERCRCVGTGIRATEFGGEFWSLKTRPSFFDVAVEGRLFLDYGDEFGVLWVRAVYEERSKIRGIWCGKADLFPRALVRQWLRDDSGLCLSAARVAASGARVAA